MARPCVLYSLRRFYCIHKIHYHHTEQDPEIELLSPYSILQKVHCCTQQYTYIIKVTFV